MSIAGQWWAAVALTVACSPLMSTPATDRGVAGSAVAQQGGSAGSGSPPGAASAATPVQPDRTTGTAAGQAGAGTPVEVDYIVARGDTLIGITTRLLKPDIPWQHLRALNQLEDTRRLLPGQRLTVPMSWLREDTVRFAVKSVSGRVTVNGEALNADSTLKETDLIETGEEGAVVVVLPDGTEMRIAPSSQVRIDRLRKYFGGETIDARMRLERGGIDAVVPHKAPNQPPKPGSIVPRIRSTAPSSGSVEPQLRIRVDTPRATAAVRGTQFRVIDDQGLTSSGVLDGVVAFSGAPGQGVAPASIDLPAGFGSVADDSGKVARPEALLPAPSLPKPDQAIAELSRKLEFDPLPGAASYRVRTAADAGFSREVVERIVKQPVALVDSQRDGTYHVAVRGISATGVEGYDAAIEVAFAARPVPPILNQPNDKDIQFGNRTRLEWFEPKGISRYRLQIARDPAFADIEIDKELETNSYAFTTPDSEPAPRKRYWRVAALDAGRNGPFPQAREFVQRDAGGPAASAEVSTGGGTKLGWAEIPDASYVVALTPLTRGATPAREISTTDPSVTLPDLAPGSYEIRIISVFEGDLRSPPSEPQRFTIPLIWRTGSGDPVMIDNDTVPAIQPD